MKKRRSPREKKDLELARDTRVVAEYPKGYRNSKPRKKRTANHKERRRTDRLLQQALTHGEEESVTQSILKPRGRRNIQNLTWPLKKFIEVHQERARSRVNRKVPRRQMVEEFKNQLHRFCKALESTPLSHDLNDIVMTWHEEQLVEGHVFVIRLSGNVMPRTLSALQKMAKHHFQVSVRCDADTSI